MNQNRIIIIIRLHLVIKCLYCTYKRHYQHSSCFYLQHANDILFTLNALTRFYLLLSFRYYYSCSNLNFEKIANDVISTLNYCTIVLRTIVLSILVADYMTTLWVIFKASMELLCEYNFLHFCQYTKSYLQRVITYRNYCAVSNQ